MVTKLVLALCALAALSQAAYCPSYNCDKTLATNVCASVTALNTFKVNANGCSSGYFCSGLSLGTWAVGYTSSSSSNYLCLPLPTVPTTTTTTVFTTTSCGSKQTLRNFKNGGALVSCSLPTDCILQDNTYTTCQCTLRPDGVGVCTPDISNDQVFGKYWNDCGTNNQITNQNRYVYWTLYTQYWTFMQSNLSCLNIFIEKQTLDAAWNAYNGAAGLTATIFAMAAFY